MPESKKEKTVAIVGCGSWGRNLIRNFYNLGVLNSIYDNDRKKMRSISLKYPGIKAWDSYEKLLMSSGVDAIVISTPPFSHYSLAKKALQANYDLFVEKPLAMKYEEGKELVRLAESKSRILMVGHLLLYHPAIERLKEIIDKGTLGKINYIYSNRLNLGTIRTEENILWSFAPHDISVMLYLLNEMPDKVNAYGGSYLNRGVTDITVTTMSFPNNVKGHIFVSWLHPYKEQKLVVIGSKGMAVFNDLTEEKLFIYPHQIDYAEGRVPIVEKKDYKIITGLSHAEPLKIECEHFIRCIERRVRPKTNGEEAIAVLRVLSDSQKALDIETPENYFVHRSSYVDSDVKIGEGTKIWHFSHILKNTKIGKNCNIGQNVMIGPNVTIGNNVKIQNNVSIYEGVTLEDFVFCGPSCVFTNVINPRSHIDRKNEFQKTIVKRGASIGANATILCGVTIGEYAFVGAGAIVTKDVPAHTLVYSKIAATEQGYIKNDGRRKNVRKGTGD